MYGYDQGVEGWAIALMSLSIAILLALLLAGVIALLRRGGAPGPDGHTGQDRARPADHSTAHRVLAERFARGEIDEEEYRRRAGEPHDVHPPGRPG